jgi:hypothetical protein
LYHEPTTKTNGVRKKAEHVPIRRKNRLNINKVNDLLDLRFISKNTTHQTLLLAWTIDATMKKKNVGESTGKIGAIYIGFDSLFQKTWMFNPYKMNPSAKTCIQSYPL